MENAIKEYINMIRLVGILITSILVITIIISILLIIKKKKNKIKCSKCNRIIDKDSIYCKWCGTKV